MADDNNPFEFFKDLSKGATEAAEAAAKTVQDGAVAVMDGFGEVIGGIVDVIGVGENDASLQKRENKLKYRNNTEVAFKCRKVEKISVCEIYLNEYDQECEGSYQEIRLTQNGIELYSENGRKRTFIRMMNIADIDLFKNGKTEGGDPVRNALMYGAIGAKNGVGALPAMLLGAACTPKSQDIWNMRIKEHDGSSRVFRLWDKSDGEKVINYLDACALA